jgi:hypothetical protein
MVNNFKQPIGLRLSLLHHPKPVCTTSIVPLGVNNTAPRSFLQYLLWTFVRISNSHNLLYHTLTLAGVTGASGSDIIDLTIDDPVAGNTHLASSESEQSSGNGDKIQHMLSKAGRPFRALPSVEIIDLTMED